MPRRQSQTACWETPIARAISAAESNARFTWNNWSRQAFKSYAFALRRIIRGLPRGRDQLFLSAGERQSRELMLKEAEHLRKLKRGFDRAEREEVFEDIKFRVLEIRVRDSIRIIGLPANPMTARGFTGDVFLDEFAMHQLDREIWAAAYGSVTRGRDRFAVRSCDPELDMENRHKSLYDNDLNEFRRPFKRQEEGAKKCVANATLW